MCTYDEPCAPVIYHNLLQFAMFYHGVQQHLKRATQQDRFGHFCTHMFYIHISVFLEDRIMRKCLMIILTKLNY